MMIRGRTLAEIAFLITLALIAMIAVPVAIVLLIVIWVLCESADLINALRGRRA